MADTENPDTTATEPQETDDQVAVDVADDAPAGGDDYDAPQEQQPEAVMSDPNSGYGGQQAIPEQSETEVYQSRATMCMYGLIVASCVALAQSARVCDQLSSVMKCDGAYAFAVAVSTISLFGTIIMVAGWKYKPEMFQGLIPYFSLFLVMWWGVGTAIATFEKPFLGTGNGYFAFWGATMISIYFAQISVNSFSALIGVAMKALAGTRARRTIMMVMIFSFVEAFACLTLDSKLQANQTLWGFLCGIISGGLIALFMVLKSFGIISGSKFMLTWIARFLVVWWLFGAGVVTFDSPFTETGNGYFMAWGSFLGSAYLMVLCETGQIEEDGSEATVAN